jgi:hypothetical protein
VINIEAQFQSRGVLLPAGKTGVIRGKMEFQDSLLTDVGCQWSVAKRHSNHWKGNKRPRSFPGFFQNAEFLTREQRTTENERRTTIPRFQLSHARAAESRCARFKPADRCARFKPADHGCPARPSGPLPVRR